MKLQAKKEQYSLGSIDLTAHQYSGTDANREKKINKKKYKKRGRKDRK